MNSVLTSQLSMCGSDLSISKTLRTKLADHCPGPRLGTGRHSDGTDLKSTAKALKTELILEPQPTKGRWKLAGCTQQDQLSAKTKLSIFSMGSQHPKPHNMIFKMSRIKSKIIQLSKNQENLNSYGKRQPMPTR